jgi:hypothetical protein
MPDTPADNRLLVKRTLITVGAMVGACVVAVGALTLVAVGFVEHTIGAPSSESAGAPVAAATAAGTPVKPLTNGRVAPAGAATRTSGAPKNPR